MCHPRSEKSDVQFVWTWDQMDGEPVTVEPSASTTVRPSENDLNVL